MSVAALRQQLADIDEAIAAARRGASWSIEGTTYTRQDLPALRDERTRVMRELRATRAALEGAKSPGIAIASWHD